LSHGISGGAAITATCSKSSRLAWALERLQVDQILDEANPFDAYNPGVVCGRRLPETVDTEDNDGQHATLEQS
jgi:hypothetical protein